MLDHRKHKQKNAKCVKEKKKCKGILDKYK